MKLYILGIRNFEQVKMFESFEGYLIDYHENSQLYAQKLIC